MTLREETGAPELLRKLKLNDFAQALQPGAEDVAAIVDLLSAHGPRTVAAVAGLFPRMPAWQLQRQLVWLVKMEVLAISAASH